MKKSVKIKLHHLMTIKERLLEREYRDFQRAVRGVEREIEAREGS